MKPNVVYVSFLYILRERVVMSRVIGGEDLFSIHSSKYTWTLTNDARKRCPAGHKPIRPSILLSLYPPICQSVRPSLCTSMRQSAHESFYPSSVCLSVDPSIILFYPCVHPFVWLSVRPVRPFTISRFIYPCVHPSLRPPICLSVHPLSIH